MPHRLHQPANLNADDNQFSKLLVLLRALQITEVSFSLNGGGDQGETSLDHVRYHDGTENTSIPEVPVGIDAVGRPAMLCYALSEFAADLPEGDWCNNEGGYGTVTIQPFADCPCDCDMTYRQDGDWEDDDELDDHLEAFVLDPETAPAGPPAIIIGEAQA